MQTLTVDEAKNLAKSLSSSDGMVKNPQFFPARTDVAVIGVRYSPFKTVHFLVYKNEKESKIEEIWETQSIVGIKSLSFDDEYLFIDFSDCSHFPRQFSSLGLPSEVKTD